jgi:hypothetical protein
MTFGRRRQQLGEKARPVSDTLHITPESLIQKDLYASLKLLPSLIRCFLIQGQYLSFLKGLLGTQDSEILLCFHDLDARIVNLFTCTFICSCRCTGYEVGHQHKKH